MTGIERLREITTKDANWAAGAETSWGISVYQAREVVAHIDALEAALNPVLSVVGRDVVAAGELIVEAFDRIDGEDQRIRELEAALGELRDWVAHLGDHHCTFPHEDQTRRIDALLAPAPAPSWPSIAEGVA